MHKSVTPQRTQLTPGEDKRLLSRQRTALHTHLRTQAHRHIGVEVTRKELQAMLAIFCGTALWPICRQEPCPASNVAILYSPLFEDTS